MVEIISARWHTSAASIRYAIARAKITRREMANSILQYNSSSKRLGLVTQYKTALNKAAQAGRI